MARRYYSLFVRVDGSWSHEFGDYDRPAVDFERQEYKDKGVRAADTKVTTWDRCPLEQQIRDKTAALNAA